MSCLLEKRLIIPVWVDMCQFIGNPIVLPSKYEMNYGEDGLLISPVVASKETEDVTARLERTADKQRLNTVGDGKATKKVKTAATETQMWRSS